MNTIAFKGFPAGLDNRAAAHALPDGCARDLVNVDVRASGKIRRRPGYTRLIQEAAPHSLFASPKVTLFVAGGALKQYQGDSSTVIHPTWGDTPTVYTRLGDEVFLSNGALTARWDGKLQDWGVPTPSSPHVMATPTGGLHAGTYQVAITWRDDAGIESGTQMPVTVEVEEGGGIVLSDFPSAPDSVQQIGVYVSSANGRDLYLDGDYPTYASSVWIQQATRTVMLTTGLADRMPPVDHLTLQNGRIYGAVDSVLYRTLPFNPYLIDSHMDGFVFESPIQGLLPTFDGLYVMTAERVYFLSQLDQAESPPLRQEVAYFGSVPRTVAQDPLLPGGFFLGDRGLIRAQPQGQIQNMTDAHVALPIASEGAAIVREIDGERFVLISTWGISPNPLVSSDW